MDDKSKQGQLRARVSVLGDKFLARTSEQASLIRELIDRFGRGESSVLQELQEIAHKIHGSAAMFGFPVVSESAAEIEQLAEALMAAPQVAAGTVVVSGAEARALQRLVECVDQLACEVGTAVAHRQVNPNS